MPRRFFGPRFERLEDRLLLTAGALPEPAGALKIAEDIGGFDGGLEPRDRFGRSVSALGDLDQDGVPDMAIGARSDDDGGEDAGAVYILFMNADGTVKSSQKISASSGNLPAGLLDAGDFFGYSVARLDDLNNDGIQDLAVGAPQDDDAGDNAGAIYVLFLNRNGTVNGHQKISAGLGLEGGDSFGQATGALGDYNGDGQPDLVVGAPGDDDGGNSNGAVHLLFLQNGGTLGSSRKISELTSGFGVDLGTNDQFGGRHVKNIGDLDGDGRDEIAVGAFRDDDGGTDRGAMYILFLDQNFNVSSNRKISDTVGGLQGELNDDDLFGMTMAPLGDVDGDGVPDIIVGSNNDDDGATDRGAVFVFLMNADGTVKCEHKISSTTGGFNDLALEDGERFGRALGTIGDLRGDGTIAVAVGAGAGNVSGGAVWLLFFDPVRPNSSPTLSQLGNRTTNEDTATGPISFTVGDAETPAGNLLVSASSSNSAVVPSNRITIGGSGTNRTFTASPLANAFGSTNITISVSDGEGGVATDSFVLTVHSVNDAPAISNIANQSIEQDSSTGAIGFTVSDIETAADSLVVRAAVSDATLLPPGSVALAGSGTNRTLTATPADGQTGSSTVTVTVEDGGGSTSTATFVVTVQEVNELPTISAIDDQTVIEDGSTSAIAFTIGDTESAAADLVVSAVSSNPALVPVAGIALSGSAAERQLTITSAANAAGMAQITVTVADEHGGMSDSSFLLTVDPVNDAPVISGLADAETNEDVPLGPITLTVSDIESDADSLTVSADSSNTTLVPAGGIVIGGAGMNRTLTVNPAANLSGTTAITVTVEDPGGERTESTFTLTVTAVNDSPSLSPIADQTTVEAMPTDPITVSVSDPDDADGDLIVGAVSDNPTLVPADAFSFSVASGGGAGDRSLVITPAVGVAGTARITVTAVDPGGAAASATFRLTVGEVDDPPVVSPIAAQVTDEDVPFSVVVTISDETPPADLTVTASSSDSTLIPPNAIQFSGTGDQREITIAPAADRAGDATVTITVGDQSGQTTDVSFEVTVNAVNDAPTVSPIADQIIDEDRHTGPLAFALSDVDTPLSSLEIRVATSDPSLVPLSSVFLGGSGPDRVVAVEPPPNAQGGPVTITLTVDDGATAVDETFDLTIRPANDPPTAADDEATTDEDMPVEIVVLSNDVDIDDDELTVSIVESANGNATVRPDGSIRFVPSPDFHGPAHVRYRIADGQGETDTASVAITVRPLNDPPTATNDAATFIHIVGGTTLDPLANDRIEPDSGESLLIAAVSPTDGGGTVAITPDGARLNYTPRAGFLGVETFGYTIADGNGGLSSATVAVAVLNPWHNAARPSDVNQDGTISPLDALLVIGRLFRDRSGPLGIPPAAAPSNLVDVNNDRVLSPNDALRIIQDLIRQSQRAEGEPPQPIPSTPITAYASLSEPLGSVFGIEVHESQPATQRSVLSATVLPVSRDWVARDWVAGENRAATSELTDPTIADDWFTELGELDSR